MNKQEKEKFIEKILSWGSWCNEVHTGELDRYVKISKVRELIKCVNEPQKVKVPRFMKEFLDFCIEDGQNGVEAYHGLFQICSSWPKDDILQWSFEDPYRFINAFHYGYEVEEEPKYYLDLPKMGMVNEISNSQLCWTNCDGGITEKEIKAIDERYWPFAVSVEKV